VVHIPATADPAQLDSIAQKVRSEARQLGNALDPLTRAAGGAAWRGHAADAFYADIDTASQSIRSAQTSLQSLASAIERGADEVRRLREHIQRLLEQERERAEQARQPTTTGGPRPG
jgi:WXG100 family type VII secretion target